MRVAVDARVATDHYPGIGRVAVQLTAALARELEPGELWTLRDARGAEARVGVPSGAPLSIRASPFSIAQQWEVPRALRRGAFDVYHSLYVGMPAFPFVPTVWTCHDLIPLAEPGVLDPTRRVLVAALHRLAARASSRIAATSEATKLDLVTRLGIAPERITVVHWGVDERFLRQSRGPAPEVLARHRVPARYLLFVGVNKPHKNLPRLVRAVARAQGARPVRDLHLVVVGPWDARYPEARRAVLDTGLEGRVHFLGPVEDRDLPALYAGATAFVFPSLFEGFGLPLLEAFACGTPTVTSDRSSLPEIAGDAALLVPPRDELALAEAIGRVVDDAGLREELGRRGRARAAEFTWEGAARKMIGIYRDVADESATRRSRGARTP